MRMLVLDVQGFKLENNKFIPKELAAYDGNKICHYVFKPPFDIRFLPSHLRKQADWLMKNHHSILWNDGFTPIHKFSNIMKNLTEQVDQVYVKGTEKMQYIKKYTLNPVIDLGDDPPLQKEKPHCFYHSNPICICALTNVYYLYNNCLMIE